VPNEKQHQLLAQFRNTIKLENRLLHYESWLLFVLLLLFGAAEISQLPVKLKTKIKHTTGESTAVQPPTPPTI